MIDNIPRLNESETIIVNTDVNTGGGIHWITLFKIENILYIYDPLGKSNKRDNQEILNDYAESQQLKIYFYPYETQYKDSSLCGWFSIYVGKVFTQQKPKTIKECDHIIYTIFGDSADDGDVQKIINAFGIGSNGQLDDIYDGINGGALSDNIKGLVDAFHGNRMGFNPAMRKILEQVGSIPIAKMYVGRTPLSKTASLLIKIFKSKRRVNISPDKLFHLFFFLVLKNGKTLVLEKLEQLNVMYLDIKKLLAVEYMPVQINQQYNINSLLSNAINKYGEYQIFDYNALQGRNCQNFLIDVMNANRIMITPLLKQFILQDVSQLVPKFASKILYWITSLKNRGDQIVQGAGNEDFIFI